MPNNQYYQTILFEKEEGVATITLNRPDVLNAWNMQMIREVMAAVEDVASDEDTKILVITGSGRAFSSGTDLKEVMETKDSTPFSETLTGLKIRGKTMTDSLTLGIHSLTKPVIAAINGTAAGIGASYALACDIRIASEDARFSMAFVNRGLIPEGGATYFLARLVGLGKACRLVFTGDIIDVREAERIGLVDEVVPAQDLMKATRELAQKIAQKPPLAVSLAKQILYEGIAEPDLAAQLNREFFLQNALFATEDVKEGVESFIQKRAPVFKGR